MISLMINSKIRARCLWEKRYTMKLTCSILFAAATLAAALPVHAGSVDTVTGKPWGKTSTGQAIWLYTLKNTKGITATITNYGGIVTSLWVPDKYGKLADVVLGYDSFAGYVKNADNPYFGAIAGRYANRIAKGKFSLDGNTYTLAINNPPNHLHGGLIGFDKRVWTASPLKSANGAALTLSYLSKDGEEGYPGNLKVNVTYTLTNDDALRIDYKAVTDKDTVVNLTSHSYFNLDGAGNGNILGTVVRINADGYTPVDSTAIPLGKVAPVAGTPFDFRKPTPIGKRINEVNEQLKYGSGYDHNWALNGTGLRLAATAYSPVSGREFALYTTQPGMQMYTGNFLDGKAVGTGGKPYKYRYGFAMETQHYPDSPNQPGFPSTELKPGEVYRQTTIYKFSNK